MSKTAIHRMEICKGCKHLSKVLTCGRPLIGSVIGKNENGFNIYGCGCFMFIKTKMLNASCPIGKW